ncbi:MAG TPA: hypothetical protein VIH12_04225, partial [Solibacillus sp.]
VVNSGEDVPKITEKEFTPTQEVNLKSKMWFKYDKDLDLLFVLLLVTALSIFIWKWRAKRAGG